MSLSAAGGGKSEGEKGENKERWACDLRRAQRDYIFDRAMKNPIPATKKKRHPNGCLFF